MLTPIGLYSLPTMLRNYHFSFSPARRTRRSFLFFLYLIFLCGVSNFSVAQTSSEVLQQDSIDYYLKVVEEGEKQVGRALTKIGQLYQKAGRYNSALNYYDQALPLLNGEGSSVEIALVFQAKGVIYEFFGDNAQPQTYYRQARNSYINASRIFENSGNANQQMDINQHLADIATKRGNFSRAVSYQNKVIKTLTQLYTDSIQTQADSFSELLNREMESSKDTIYIKDPETAAVSTEGITLTNWRHLLILLLAIGLLVSVAALIKQRNQVGELEDQVRHSKLSTQQLKQQKEELQTLNVTLTRTEKEQRSANQTKDKLFSIISHDLRSPINTITGFLNILRAKLTSIGDIELKDLAAEMVQTTDRLSHFLDDLLRWSMTQLGQIKPTVEQVDVKNLVEENFQLVKPRLNANNINFKVSIPDDISVYGDTNMVRLILRNLIGNALKFTRKGGYIAVSLKTGGQDTSIIEVSDDGIGMSEEKQQEIFEFTRSEINGGNGNQGAGLGLLLCKEFAQLNGGDIEVTSKLGEGTTFQVSLPSAPA